MTIHTSIRLLLAAICLPTLSFAQSIMTGAQPIGMPIDAAGSGSAIMGGTGTGVASNRDIMSRNVANLAVLKNMTFGATFAATVTRINKGSEHTDHIRSLPRQFGFGIPLADIATIGISYSKQSDMNTRILPDRIGYSRISNDISGGLSTWQLGLGRSINKHFNLGLSLARDNFNKSSLTIKDIYWHPDSAELAADDYPFFTELDSLALLYRGNRIGAGIIGNYRGFSAGASFTLPFGGYLTTDRFVRDTNRIERRGHLGPNSGSSFAKMSLPPTLRLGLGYTFSSKLSLAADGSAEFWKTALSTEDAKLLVSTALHNAGSLAAGLRFSPDPDLLLPRYWETIQYCAGARYARLPDGKTQEFSLTAGTGLPLHGLGFLDLGLEGGIRGNAKTTAYKERYINLTVGVNGGRTWTPDSDNGY